MKKITLSIVLCAALAVFSANAENNSQITTFEDLILEPESHFPGNWTPVEDSITSFVSGNFRFTTNSNSSYPAWAFIGVSRQTDTVFASYDTDQFHNVVGHGVDNSPTFAIANIAPHLGVTSIYPLDSTSNQSIKGMYITNSSCTYNSIINGDYMETPFKQGDSLILVIDGLVNDSIINTAHYSLADYRSNESIDHYALNTWQWIDLSNLGEVDELQFNIIGSRNGDWGLNSPAYFSFDNLNAPCPEHTIDEQALSANATLDLSTLSIFNKDNGKITYTLLEKSENISVASISASTLSATLSDETGEVLIKAFQKGKSDFIRIPLKRTQTSNDNIVTELSKVWSNNGNIYVECSANTYNIEVYTITGTCIYNSDNISGCHLFSTNVENNVLIVRVITDNNINTSRVIL